MTKEQIIQMIPDKDELVIFKDSRDGYYKYKLQDGTVGDLKQGQMYDMYEILEPVAIKTIRNLTSYIISVVRYIKGHLIIKVSAPVNPETGGKYLSGGMVIQKVTDINYESINDDGLPK